MTVKIGDLMARRVFSAAPHHKVGYLRGIMERRRIHAVPVVGTNGEPVGIVTTADLARRVKDESPVSRIMSKSVTVICADKEAGAAARVMRKHRIHHLVVTHKKKVSGIISSFDLLKLIEGLRFTAKSTAKTEKRSRKGS